MKKIEKTFFESYEAYSDEIFRFILFKISDREKAKDLLQEVFMKTWLYISRNGNIENIRAFLYKAAGNRVIDEYRSQGKKEGNSESLETLSEESGYDPAFDDTDSLIDKIDGEEAMKFIKELPGIYSEALFLRFVENHNISEIAAEIGESPNIVSVRINRGLKKLKKAINEKYKKTQKER